ncbi:MAG: hypothetical protein KQJ78_07675 [Deltaproteobacteria bacterium]|nr:hypothetical protein [Deltaproteobacteria bacterium]
MGLAAFNRHRRLEAAKRAAAEAAAKAQAQAAPAKELPKTLKNQAPETPLGELTVRQLRDVAKVNDVNIPAGITRKEELVAFLEEARAARAGEEAAS